MQNNIILTLMIFGLSLIFFIIYLNYEAIDQTPSTRKKRFLFYSIGMVAMLTALILQVLSMFKIIIIS